MNSKILSLWALLLIISVSAQAEALKALTYNAGLLSVLGHDLVPAVNARARALPTRLAQLIDEKDLDIIILQEVWCAKDAKRLTRMLRQKGFTTLRPDPRHLGDAFRFRIFNSGLLMAIRTSKAGLPHLQVLESQFTRFRAGDFANQRTTKGILSVKVRTTEGSDIWVLGTHTQSIDTDNGVPTNSRQVRIDLAQQTQLKNLLQRFADVPVLAMGDFNVGPNYADANYRFLLEDCQLTNTYSGQAPSWDPTNPTVKYGLFPNEPASLIDHIFYRNGALSGQWQVDAASIVLQERYADIRIHNEASALSDHYGLMAELQLEP